MRKKIKLFLLIILAFLVVVVVFYVGLMYYWNTSPEPICNRAGGFWGFIHNNDCSDLCDKGQTNIKCEDRLRTMGCSCGLDKCWDGEECVEKIK